VCISTTLAAFRAFWGIIENLHEGWYHPMLAPNLAMMFGQYLMPLFVFVIAGAVGIRWPRTGGIVHGAGGVFVRSKSRQPDYFGYRCVREPSR